MPLTQREFFDGVPLRDRYVQTLSIGGIEGHAKLMDIFQEFEVYIEMLGIH